MDRRGSDVARRESVIPGSSFAPGDPAFPHLAIVSRGWPFQRVFQPRGCFLFAIVTITRTATIATKETSAVDRITPSAGEVAAKIGRIDGGRLASGQTFHEDADIAPECGSRQIQIDRPVCRYCELGLKI